MLNRGAQILSISAAPTELARKFLGRSYKDFAPTEHVPLRFYSHFVRGN